MGKRLVIVGALALIIWLPAYATEVFFCNDGSGKKSAQDHPCSETAASQRREEFKKPPPPAVGSEAWNYQHQQRWDTWSKDVNREITCRHRRQSAERSEDAARRARTNEQAAASQDNARRARTYVDENCVGIGH